MTELKDVVHFYIGQNVMRPDGKTTLPIFGVEGNLIVHREGNELTYSGITVCKLILRPLSDMKIEEGAWCLQETYFQGREYPIKDFRIELVGQSKNNPRVWIDNDWFTEELTFGSKVGAIWCAKDGLPCNTKLRASVFAYLIKQGFDLFGLIENGFALNHSIICGDGKKEENKKENVA